MNQEGCNKSLVEGRVGEWIETYLSGEIGASVLSCLIVLEKLLGNELPLKVKATINVAIGCLTLKKHLSPKQEQDIKNALNEAKKAFNEGDHDGVDSAMGKIIGIVKMKFTRSQ